MQTSGGSQRAVVLFPAVSLPLDCRPVDPRSIADDPPTPFVTADSFPGGEGEAVEVGGHLDAEASLFPQHAHSQPGQDDETNLQAKSTEESNNIGLSWW